MRADLQTIVDATGRFGPGTHFLRIFYGAAVCWDIACLSTCRHVQRCMVQGFGDQLILLLNQAVR